MVYFASRIVKFYFQKSSIKQAHSGFAAEQIHGIDMAPPAVTPLLYVNHLQTSNVSSQMVKLPESIMIFWRLNSIHFPSHEINRVTDGVLLAAAARRTRRWKMVQVVTNRGTGRMCNA